MLKSQQQQQQQLSICLLSDLGLGLGPVLGLGLGLELQQLVAVCCEDVACLAAWLCWSGFPPSLSPTTPSSIALCSLPDKFNDSSSSRDSISHLAILKISCKCSNISVCLTYSFYPSPTRPCPARSQSVKCTLTFNIAFVYSIILYIFLIFLLFIVYRSQWICFGQLMLCHNLVKWSSTASSSSSSFVPIYMFTRAPRSCGQDPWVIVSLDVLTSAGLLRHRDVSLDLRLRARRSCRGLLWLRGRGLAQFDVQFDRVHIDGENVDRQHKALHIPERTIYSWSQSTDLSDIKS